MSFEEMWRALAPVGLVRSTGGYNRSPFESAERECVRWYVEEAARRNLDVHTDGQGNMVAWWRPDGSTPDRVQDLAGLLVGSHLDSVRNGGAFDGPLGVVSAFAAIDELRGAGVRPKRPVGVAMFLEEEGSRFGVACLGSRLATGLVEPEVAAALTDERGVRFDEAAAATGLEPRLGQSELLKDVAAFVELHVEQGRDLVDRERPLAVASSSWAHGRWRFSFRGEPNHAGATRMEDRHDPMLTYAMTALAANKQARVGGGRATFGRVSVEPNVTNAVPEAVQAWMDARGADVESLEQLVAAVERQAAERAARDGTRVEVVTESASPTVDFDPTLSARIAELLDDAPMIPTGAGHDAAILQQAGIPSAMLFVRNPTGVSHSPAEFAETADCLVGVRALAATIEELAGDPLLV